MIKNQITIKKIASELGVSISTVSRALKNNTRIGLKTREKVWEVAKRLNYIPNPAALFLQNNKTYTIGIIVPFLQEEFFSQVVTGIEDVIFEEGFHPIISQSRDNMEREKKAVESFLKMRVDGVLVSVSAETNTYQHFKELEKYGIPVVFFDRVPRNFQANKVKSRIIDGALEAIRFLSENKKTRIGLLNGPSNLEASDERLNGYLEGIKKYDLKTSPQYIKTTNLSKEDTALKMKEFLAQDDIPEAIITFNDYVALYAMRACKEQGVIPNKDIQFVSFANLPITGLMENPPLASVEQFPVLIGSQSAKLLLNCINDTREYTEYQEVIIKTELIIH
ncbi:substrate-binding domain-containing protein [Emticicia sp. CRIBPO]|uniref:LacI family DNA-binding transcriptional regulator n=1 Tax=Emticicia sp. CRIBPO TaxID=2683258 RepID=UPI001411DE21|nr:LacI family DNA-binding transcriptional regulator [Emticicia sp. CRIBPO]NBA88764.1 substrate-binding domain-containing protein [Emticicia sp. CRIBPO]